MYATSLHRAGCYMVWMPSELAAAHLKWQPARLSPPWPPPLNVLVRNVQVAVQKVELALVLHELRLERVHLRLQAPSQHPPPTPHYLSTMASPA